MGGHKVQHPGSILKTLLAIFGIPIEDFIKATGMDRGRVLDILGRRRKLIRESATAIAKAFHAFRYEDPYNDWHYWLTLQQHYEDKFPVALPRKGNDRSREPGKRIPTELRERVLELVDEGKTSEEVGEMVGLKKMSVAGIRAADTKGLYS